MSDDTRPDVLPEESAASEAYRILRSTLKFASSDSAVRSVLVVDIDRTTPSGVARRLAASFARAGDRCVLVETDSRLGVREPGFTDLIAGGTVRDVMHTPGPSEPAVVTPGSNPDPDMLASEGCARALDALIAVNDFAILSAASLPAHGDALSIAPRVDAVILVITSGRTRRPRAVDARDALDRVGARMLGVVMLEERRSVFS